MKTVRNKKLYQCEKCFQYYKSNKSLQFHLKNRHSSHPTLFKCDRCESRYFTKWRLNRHKMTHLNQLTGVSLKVCTLSRASNALSIYLYIFLKNFRDRERR
jgi:hypothetical protein